MSDITESTIALQSAIERLRQESETFDQNKRQEERWFRLRLRMGYVAVILLPAVAVICGFVIANPHPYSAVTVTAATATLFTDVVGLLAAVWKVVLNSGSVVKLSPVTQVRPPSRTRTVT